MNTWFSSDLHLGHDNIRKYCKRPFSSLEEMNETIIRNFNSRIKEDDFVYFLGDFCFRNSPGGKEGEGAINKAEYYQSKLNGKWIFIKGNHDRNNSLKTPIRYIVIEFGGYVMKLVHNPQHASSEYPINLVGHVHERWKIKRLSKDSIMYNVGVDTHSFMPVSLNDITRGINEFKKCETTRQKQM